MKRVFVVDDEKLVRQGIMTTFPWSKYGLRVVGEAASGEQAIERLDALAIDLLVTDLTMPGMSGFELIRKVRQRQPQLPIVVLTCHDSFKFIQEAMRLGVIDYIVKTEIVDELIEETLERVAAKLQANGDADRAGGRTTHAASRYAEEGLLICGRGGSGIGLPHESDGLHSEHARHDRVYEIDRRTWFLAFPSEAEGERAFASAIERLDRSRWAVVRIRGVRRQVDEEWTAALRRYRWRKLFYTYREHAPAETADADRLAAFQPPASSRETDAPQRLWESPTWIHDDDAFERLLRETSDGAVEPAGLKSLFYHAALEWDRLLGLQELQKLMEASEHFLFWIDWERWLRNYRGELRRKLNRGAASGVQEAIAKAIAYVRTAEELDMNEADVAREVNMSRGYFSTCFKKVTGQTFGEYLKQVKLEKARLLILRTDDSITLTAEKCGFRDYRYFSRVFREYTGLLPNEYRRSGGRTDKS